MFHYLTTLEEGDLAAILDAVQAWCRAHQVDIETSEGHSVLAAAIDQVQATGSSIDLRSTLFDFLDARARSIEEASDHIRSPDQQ